MRRTRTPFLFLLASLLMLFCVSPGRAHDGPHGPDMLAVVTATTQRGGVVSVSLVLTGLGGPLVLTGVSADGAQAARMDPVYVNFAQDVPVTTELQFFGPVPGIFTLELDFGPVGRRAVSVVTRRDTSR